MLETRVVKLMLETRVVKLEQQIDENSAHERKNTLIMAGTIPPASHAEDCKFIVWDQIREHLSLELAIDISMEHQISVEPKIQRENKRNIMFKLCNRDVKQNISKNCKVVKPKKFYINESLTPLRNTILYVMRQVKKKHPSVINICNSSDGSVVAWLHAASASAKTKYWKIIINTKKELDLFLQQELNSKATAFIDTCMACFISFIMQNTNYASLSSIYFCVHFGVNYIP